MKSINETTAELVKNEYLRPENIGAAHSILVQYHEAAADAQAEKAFAVEDQAYQKKVIRHAEDLAETDLEMGQIEDRFIQASVIDSASSLSDKDEALFEQADAQLVAACGEAATALARADVVSRNDLEAVTRLIAGLWNTNAEDDAE